MVGSPDDHELNDVCDGPKRGVIGPSSGRDESDEDGIVMTRSTASSNHGGETWSCVAMSRGHRPVQRLAQV